MLILPLADSLNDSLEIRRAEILSLALILLNIPLLSLSVSLSLTRLTNIDLLEDILVLAVTLLFEADSGHCRPY